MFCQGILEEGPDFIFIFNMTEDYDQKKKKVILILQ